MHLIYLDFYSFYYDSHNFGTKKYQFYICTKLSLFLLNILHLVILSTALSVTSERRFISFKREQEFFYQKNLLTDKFSRPNHVITSYLQLQFFPDKLLLQSEVVFFDFIHCVDYKKWIIGSFYTIIYGLWITGKWWNPIPDKYNFLFYQHHDLTYQNFTEYIIKVSKTFLDSSKCHLRQKGFKKMILQKVLNIATSLKVNGHFRSIWFILSMY